MACHNMTKPLPIQCHLLFLRQMSVCLSIKRFGMRLSCSCLKNFTTDAIKGKYAHRKLKMWKECIKTNCHGQDVPVRHALQCNGGVKNYHPQVYVEECKYSDVEN